MSTPYERFLQKKAQLEQNRTVPIVQNQNRVEMSRTSSVDSIQTFSYQPKPKP